MKRTLIISVAMLTAFVGALTLRSARTQAVVGAVVGQPAPEFALKDLAGRAHRITDYRGKPLVIAFISAKCPVSNDYNERIRAIAEDYAAKGVAFVGINANNDESKDEARAHSEKHGFKFPVLKDEGNVVADAYGAMRTPEIYIVDGRGVLRYHGRIDGSRDPARIQRHDLRATLDEMVAGKEISTPETKAFGCVIIRAQSSLLDTVDGAALAQAKGFPVKLLKPTGYAPMVKQTAAARKVLVVNFWATWCGPCIAEFPEFIKLDQEYRAKGVRVVGISADEVTDLQPKVVPFVKQKKVSFEIFVQDVQDPQEMIDVVDKKWEGTLPATFVYDRTGKPILVRYGIINRDQLVQAIEQALK